MATLLLVSLMCVCANAQFVYDQQYHLRPSHVPMTMRRENINTTRQNNRPMIVTANLIEANVTCTNAAVRLKSYAFEMMVTVVISLCILLFLCNVLSPAEEVRNDRIKPH